MVACVLCHGAEAVVFCYNDNANLCKACDAQIHKTNKLTWRHQRVYLCEVCEGAPKPACVYCAQDKVRADSPADRPDPNRGARRVSPLASVSARVPPDLELRDPLFAPRAASSFPHTPPRLSHPRARPDPPPRVPAAPILTPRPPTSPRSLPRRTCARTAT